MIRVISKTNDICKNCGKNWGGHHNQYCDRYQTSVFEPIDINTICLCCGRPMHEHIAHVLCYKFKPDLFLFDDGVLNIKECMEIEDEFFRL